MGKISKWAAALAIAAAGGLVSTPPAAAAPASPFVGSWENVDDTDGSHQRMSIGGSGHFRYRDDAASACLDAGLGFVPASLSGTGAFVDPTTFAFTADLYCHVRGPGGKQLLLSGVTLVFSYDAVSGTLSDSFEQGCWYRSGNPGACA